MNKKLIGILLVFLVIGVFYYFGVWGYIAGIPPEEKIEPRLLEKEGNVRVEISLVSPQNTIIREKLKSKGLEIQEPSIWEQQSWVIGRTDTSNLLDIASVPQVSYIVWVSEKKLDVNVPCEEYSPTSVGLTCDTCTQDVYRLDGFDNVPDGVDGSGVTVGIVDSGVNCTAIENIDGFHGTCTELNPNANVDGSLARSRHGTSVAHIIATLAPGVTINSFDVCDPVCDPRCHCSGAQPSLRDGINNLEGQSDILSISMRGAGLDSLETAIQSGTIGVTSAGNGAYDYDDNQRNENTVSTPGTLEEAITVGGVSRDLQVMCFSGQGPVTREGGTYIKPDITAIGQEIRGAIPQGGYESGGFWLESSSPGTSAAAPQISALAALVLDANSNCMGNPDLVKEMILSTPPRELPEDGEECPDNIENAFSCVSEDNDYGLGFVQAGETVTNAQSLLNQGICFAG